MMTFESNYSELDDEHLNELATFIHDIDLIYIPFTGAEVKSLFDFDQIARDLKEFEWNIRGSFIAGQIDDRYTIISPEKLMSEPVENNTWFEYAQTSSILNFLRNRLGSVSLLNKLQLVLDDNFDYLSQGQAKSVLKRYLGLTLSSAERNDIYRLRKKIEGYRQVIEAFSDKLAVNRKRPDRYIDHQPTAPKIAHSELIDKMKQSLAFMCWECKEHMRFPDGEVVTPPVHHDKPMTLNWNVSDIDLSMEAHRELENAISNPNEYLKPVKKETREVPKPPEGYPKLYCSWCDQEFPIEEDLEQRLYESDHRISLPEHHGKEMQIITHPQIMGLTDLGLGDKYDELTKEKDPGLYFICPECLIMLAAQNIDLGAIPELDRPTHHGRAMKPVVIRDYKN